MKSVSIIIPTSNRASILDVTLTAIRDQNYSKDQIEVLVCSDGSNDNTDEVVLSQQKKGLNVRFFETGITTHFAAGVARNTGIQYSNGDLLIFLDDDRIPKQDFVENHVDLHEGNKLKDQIVIYGPRFGPASIGTFDIPYPNSNDPQWQEISHLFQDYFDAPWQWATTAALSVPADITKKIGGFNEDFREYGFEDTDFAYRLHQSGCRFVFDPKLSTTHNADFSNFARNKKIIALRKSLQIFRQLHPEVVLEKMPYVYMHNRNRTSYH